MAAAHYMPQTCIVLLSVSHDHDLLTKCSPGRPHLALGRPCTQGAPLRDRLARIWAGVEACGACLAPSAAGEAA